MLFSNVNEIKTILPIGVGNDFNRLKPHIENVENRYIKPLLGFDMYEALVTLYGTEESQGPSDETPEAEEAYSNEMLRRELLYKIQFATIHLAFFTGFDFLNVSVTDAGFQRIETERTKGLFKYQEDSLKSYFSETGFNALDDVLTFLEFNIDSFEEFMNSENFNKIITSFLPNVKTIEEIPFNIHRSNLIFLALKPSIAYVEDTAIRPVLGEAIYVTVKTEMAKAEMDEKVIALLPYIRKPLIYYASAMLMEETGATLFERGLFFDKNEDQQRAKVVRGPSPDARVEILVNRNRRIGDNYLEMLKAFLLENWEEYSGQVGSAFKRDNNGKKTFFT
jgi:hypothetical protein